MIGRALAAAALAWGAGPASAAACRLALVLALDVSGSVDETEYVLQLNGIATAFETPAVQEALFAIPDAAVAVSVFEWSSSSYQRRLLDWIELRSAEDVGRLVATLRAWRRSPAPEATGLGAALRAAGAEFRTAPPCWRRVIDVSGDGKNNDWPVPGEVRASGELGEITVNALVIGQDMLRSDDRRQASIAELTQYFRAEVIHGPGAFVEVALGYDDYAAAMTRKLLRELSAPPIGRGPELTGPGTRLAVR